MTFRDTLSMAFMSLWQRKLRAVLTVLGMVVGTASIIVMVSLGIGINVSYQESLEQAGSLTLITVSAQNWDKYWQNMESSSGGGAVIVGPNDGPETVDINDKTIELFKTLEGVKAVTPVLTTYNGYFKSGKYVCTNQLIGIDGSVADVFGLKLQEGEMFGESAPNMPEVVMGSMFVNNFYNTSNYSQAIDRNGEPIVKPMSSRIQLTFDSANIYTDGGDGTRRPGKMYNVKVTGVLAESTDWSKNNSAYMNVKSLKNLMKANKSYVGSSSSNSKTTYDTAWIMAESVDDVFKIQEEVEAMGYGTSSLGDALKQAQDSSASLRGLLGAIGAVALLVAAIGIMNTMMMAIYERTKEIGIIKVLGCRMKDILGMFLLESAFIGFFGGVIGAGLSYGLGSVLNNYMLGEMGMRSVIPLWLSVGAIGFSVVVSTLSGLYPSIKAMRLSPLQAIRTE